MRGFLQPAHRSITTETQKAFASLSRERRMKLAKAAQTDLVKASQWARGGGTAPDVAEALERVTKAHMAKRK